MTRVSIIIVNYNSASDVLRCLESISRWSRAHAHEVIVVDNASRAVDVARIESGAPHVVMIRNSRNLGFGSANNRGAAHASGEYLFFLNPDTYFLNDALGEFLAFMESEPGRRAGVAGCILEDRHGNENHSYGSFRSMTISEFVKQQVVRVPRSAYRALAGRPDRVASPRSEPLCGPVQVDWVTGADLFVRREAFESVGGFDERIFLYSEEVDLQRRLRRKGWSRWILGIPRIAHTHGRFDRASNTSRLHLYRGLFTYFRLYEPGWMVHAALAIFKLCALFIAVSEVLRAEYSLQETFDFLRKLKAVQVRDASSF